MGANLDPCEQQENARAVADGPVGSITRPDGLVLTGTPRARAAVEFALAQLGKWYVWGGTGPDGWDCSGLTQGAWSHAGVAIDRVSEDQISNGVPVSPSEARTGDLAFLASGGSASRPGHVGIVAGTLNGTLMLVHAPGRGKQLKIQPFSNWDGIVVGVRRIV